MTRSPAANSYLKTKILTANPQELRLMLYDGAIRFCRQGREAMDVQDFEASHEALLRAQKIVLELSTSLNRELDPALCERLAALYTYIYRGLVEANVERTTGRLDDAIKLLEFERETWVMLMAKAAEHAAAGSGNVTGAQQTAISSLSTEG